jgi:hypothetical protein
MSTGYHIYSNTGAGDPINYASPTATVSALTHLDVVYSLLSRNLVVRRPGL